MVRSKRIAVALLVVAGMWATRAIADESPAAQMGHNLYSEHCQICHGLRGKGDGEFVDVLRIPPADLTEIAKRRSGVFPEVEVREIIDGRRKVRAHGSSGMPIWGRAFGVQGPAGSASEQAIRDKISSLVEYLKSIQVMPNASGE
jgi:mono/diheme cytochrome c family protein